MSVAREPVDGTGEQLRNQALVEAMRAVSVQDTPERRALLFRLLLDSTVIVATPDTGGTPGIRTAEAGEQLSLVTFRDGDETVLPVFTSAPAVLAWRPGGTAITAMPTRALLEMAASADTGKIVIDPGSPTYGYLTRGEIRALAQGRLPLGSAGEVVPEETQVRIGRPQQPPGPSALASIRAALDSAPEAEQAWYFLMQQGQAAPELCIAIRLAPGVTGEAERRLVRSVIDQAAGESDEVKSLSFMIAGNLRSGL